jgi:hypothetical protein
LQFGFATFWKKEIGSKDAQKLVVELTTAGISPTFYEQLLCKKVHIMCLQFGFVIFWLNEIGAKSYTYNVVVIGHKNKIG